jgi:glycerol-3-phosphate dehydrogenase
MFKHHASLFLRRGARRALSTRAAFPPREAQIAALGSDEFDVIIVGAGATGSGAALDAATRGLKVACIERGDFSSETSARSTKLIWAGIRYIGTAVAALLSRRLLTEPIVTWRAFVGEMKMVLGAHRERRFLLETQRHLTSWVPIAVPVDKWLAFPAPMGHPIFSLAPMLLPLVFRFYDALSWFTCPPSHVMNRSRCARKFPQLENKQLKYAQIFYEGQHDDARTCITIALSAAAHGAAIANYVEAAAIVYDAAGKATGVVAKDLVAGGEMTIRAKKLIFAGGPFTDELRELESEGCPSAVRGAAGTHIVLPSYYCPAGIGLLDINTSDGRFLFLLPWKGSVLVGTTDRPGVPISSPSPPEDEIEWLLAEVSRYLSDDLRVRRSDVLSAWQGWRPLASDPHAPPGAPASRDHIVSTNPATGITFVTGGKWTTYREMAEDAVDRVVELGGDAFGASLFCFAFSLRRGAPQLVPQCGVLRFKLSLASHAAHLAAHATPCVTSTTKLLGAEGYDENLPIQLVQSYGIATDAAAHLSKAYGGRAHGVCARTAPTGEAWPKYGVPLAPGYPYLESEVEQAVLEYARTVKVSLFCTLHFVRILLTI